MDRKIRKFISLGLATLLGAGMLAGCGGNNKSDSKVKLTLWTYNNLNAYLDSYNNVECFKLMQEKNNVEVEFIHPVVGQQNEQFTVLLASGDYPDIINYQNWENYKGGLIRAINDGVLIDLAPYVNKDKMPNLDKLLNEDTSRKKAISNTDGSISIFPTIKESIRNNGFIGPILRQDWLDKLGLEVPETIDEWYNVLTAFKTQDPNGNGIADEIPMSSNGINSPFHYFSAAWGAGTLMLLDETGTPAYGPIQPGFKDFLITMNKWYKEGLLDKDFAATDTNGLSYKVTSDLVGSYVGYTGSQMGNYIAAKKGTDFKLVAAPWVKKDKSSPAYCGFDGMIQTVNINNGMGISTQNKHVDESIKMIDWLYGDGAIAVNYGIEGTTYNIENGEYVYTDLVLNNQEGKDPVAALAPYALPNWCIGGTVLFDNAYDKIARAYDEQRHAAKIWTEGDTSLCLPSLAFTEEESNDISSVRNDINTYVMEYMVKVIIGTESVDTFDNYVQTVNSMGVDKMVNAYKAAYDRYLNN